MNMKNYIRNFLLVFAVGSVAYLAVMEIAQRRANVRTATTPSSAEVGPSTKLVVYYFSEGKECATCERIPLLARAALDEYFADAMKSGEIVWCPIDVDEARNAHYIDEYGIYTKSIVLARIENGKQTRWRSLDRVWDLVYDKDAFVEYVRDEVRADLETAA